MRYSTIYVDSADKWAVIDTLSDGSVLQFHDSEKEALKAAIFEETRWDKLVNSAFPPSAVSAS